MRALLLAAALAATALAAPAAEAPKLDPHYPFRVDWANQQLPWYQLQPGVFPPHHSDHRVGGTLIAADFIHRAGRFRIDHTGEVVDFTMPPFATIAYHNAEAELRDVPLGTFFLFFLHQDAHGAFTRVATMQDEYSMLANHGFTWRIAGLRLGDGRLDVVKQKLSENKLDERHDELLVDAATRVWKGDQQVKLADLAVGDVLLIELGEGRGPRRCSDLYVGVDTHAAVTGKQRKSHVAYLKERGLPAWIDKIEGKQVTVSLFGDRQALLALFTDEDLDPAKLAFEHRHVEMVVANQELRSYNPPVDKRGTTVISVQTVPTDFYGCSGERWVVEPDLLLEGFRVGSVVRLFASPKWPINDMPFGEGAYEHAFEANDLDPRQFTYRTDFANADLPWYRFDPGAFPPAHAQHEVWADLIEVDALARTARLRSEHGEQLDVALSPGAAVLYRGAEAELAEVPPGTRLRVGLHQDAHGAFTWATTFIDDFTSFSTSASLWRIEAIQPGDGPVPGQPPTLARLIVARQLERVTNYKNEEVRPPDVSRCLLAIGAQTRIWKGDQRIQLADLAVGDELLANLGGRSPTSDGRCTDLWLGADACKQVAEHQRTQHRALVTARGITALVERVDGRDVTLVFCAASRADFPALYDGDPWGKGVWVQPLDGRLQATAPLAKVNFKNHLPKATPAARSDAAACAGCSRPGSPRAGGRGRCCACSRTVGRCRRGRRR
ncbi:MAG: hypothetical protein H0X38_13385 [Planctomycetes bacterium]|nr:hypothetical protein [Planctomycetota bacterium]